MRLAGPLGHSPHNSSFRSIIDALHELFLDGKICFDRIVSSIGYIAYAIVHHIMLEEDVLKELYDFYETVDKR